MTDDDAHWRALIATIIERIGAERFVELSDAVLNQGREPDAQAFFELRKGGGFYLPMVESKPDA